MFLAHGGQSRGHFNLLPHGGLPAGRLPRPQSPRPSEAGVFPGLGHQIQMHPPEMCEADLGADRRSRPLEGWNGAGAEHGGAAGTGRLQAGSVHGPPRRPLHTVVRPPEIGWTPLLCAEMSEGVGADPGQAWWCGPWGGCGKVLSVPAKPEPALRKVPFPRGPFWRPALITRR